MLVAARHLWIVKYTTTYRHQSNAGVSNGSVAVCFLVLDLSIVQNTEQVRDNRAMNSLPNR